MDRPIVTIPRELWREFEMDWHIDWRGQAAGTTQAGQTKVVYNAFPRWKGTPKFILHGENFLKWRAIQAEAMGHVGIYRVPMRDPIAFLRPNTNVPLTDVNMTTGLGLEFTPTSLAVGDHAIGVDTVRLDTSPTGEVPVAGQTMSHGEDWPFVIRSLDPVDGEADQYDLRIAPPLRATMPNGQEVRYEAIGRFELANRDQGFPPYGVRRVARVSIPLQEVLTR